MRTSQNCEALAKSPIIQNPENICMQTIWRRLIQYCLLMYLVRQQNITSFLFMYGHQTGKCCKILYAIWDIPVGYCPACVYCCCKCFQYHLWYINYVKILWKLRMKWHQECIYDMKLNFWSQYKTFTSGIFSCQLYSFHQWTDPSWPWSRDGRLFSGS